MFAASFVFRPMRSPSEFAATTPMKPSQGDAMSHPITELEASRAVLVQGLPLLDQELTESSIVQVSYSPLTTNHAGQRSCVRYSRAVVV